MRRFLLLTIILAARANAADAVPPHYPLTAFVELPAVEDATISPAGDAIAAKIVVNGQQQLAVVPLAENSKPHVMSVDKADLDWFTWANNDWLVASISRRFEDISLPSISGRNLAIPRSGGRPVKFASEDDVFWTSANGESFALAENGTYSLPGVPYGEERASSVVKVTLATGKSVNVVPNIVNVIRWFADEHGVVRAAERYNRTKRETSILYRPDEQSDFEVIARANLKAHERVMTPAFFGPDPKKITVWSDHEDYSGLYEFDVTSKSFGERVLPDRTHEARSFSLSPDGLAINSVRYSGDRNFSIWRTQADRDLQADLDASVGDRTAYVSSMSTDQQRMIVEVYSPTSPPAYWIMDRATGKMRKFAATYPGLAGATLAPTTAISYKARDGLEIPALLTLPVGRPNRGLPLIVLLHDSVSGRSSFDWNYQAQFLANRGYAVLQPNHRGSSGYGEAFQRKADGQWGGSVQDDIADGVIWATTSGLADPKRVCIFGRTFGGYSAVQSLVRNPGLYRCAISVRGIFNFPAQKRLGEDGEAGKEFEEGLRRGVPDFQAVSPFKHADKINSPVLLIHGKLDIGVPYAQSVEMAQALKDQGKTVELFLQPNSSTLLRIQADRTAQLARIEAFLARYNPAS